MSLEYIFPSPEWGEAYCKALNESEAYAKAAKDWTAGTILLLVRDPPKELQERYGGSSMGFVLDLHQGKCRGVRWVIDPGRDEADFIISAKYETWLEVIAGRLHPTTALMTMRLRVEKGDVSTLLRYAQAAIEMVKAAQNVPTKIIR